MSGLEIADVDDDDSYRAVMKREGEKRKDDQQLGSGDVTREREVTRATRQDTFLT